MTTSPLGISPEQLNLLHIVCAIAGSDGNLSAEELALMSEQFSALFAIDEAHQEILRQEIQNSVSQNIFLEELVSKLPNVEDRELALKLSYMVIKASSQADGEPTIDKQEKVAYRRLVELLALPEEIVGEVEWAADEELKQHDNLIHALVSGLTKFFQG